MSVHLQIKDQINTFIQAEKQYRNLNDKRENLIEAVLKEAKEGTEFSVANINEVSLIMNELAKKYGFPPRKLVTKEMVLQYLGLVN